MANEFAKGKGSRRKCLQGAEGRTRNNGCAHRLPGRLRNEFACSTEVRGEAEGLRMGVGVCESTRGDRGFPG